MAPKHKIQIVVPANLDYSALIRHIADEVFRIARFSKSWASRLKLVVDELYMNAVGYGSTKDTSEIHISFEYDEAAVTFTIQDDGTGKKAVPAEELKKIIETNRNNTDLTRTSGRGLAMIAALWTDAMEVNKSEFGGVAISFTKNVDGTENPPPPPPMPEEWVAAAKANLAPNHPPVPGHKTLPGSPEGQAAEQQVQAPVAETREVAIKGDIDQTNLNAIVSPVFDQIELMPEGGTLIINMDGCNYINSSFIGHLAAWHTSMQHKKGKVVVKNLSKEVKEILELVGLLKVLQAE